MAHTSFGQLKGCQALGKADKIEQFAYEYNCSRYESTGWYHLIFF